MGFTITIRNSGEQYLAEEGETILEAALRQGIPLPHGCKAGVCGACILTIIEGRIEYPDDEPFALMVDDTTTGKGLCCIGHPASDLVIELDYPEVDFEPWV